MVPIMTVSAYASRQLYYDGKVQSATSGKTFTSVNPATAKPLAEIHVASTADVDAAVHSAKQAFLSWSVTTPLARARILLHAVKILRERNDELSKTETEDSGKPYSETSTCDVVTGADVVEYYANLVGAGGLNGETTHLREDAWVYTKKEPLGVCAGIGAWNYPIQMYACKSPPSMPDVLSSFLAFQSTVEVSTVPGCRKHHGLQAERIHFPPWTDTGGNLHRGGSAARRVQCCPRGR